MTSSEIRRSFLDFFKSKQHAIVPSASLMPQSPGLLFTNAGMNQFVPYFLGTEKAPYRPERATDTQKCIRAGGKHNDLEDVGYDACHHTFFEMLGNWSFGDYFKKETIEWSWELIVETWNVPAKRLYATVYAPSEGDPSEFDQASHDLWSALFRKAGLDPEKHIVNGNVKDNFWMMGETGPCGPCSELHVDLTPEGDTEGRLVNMDSDLCIEIWNLVFIQYNAEADGTFRDLPERHVDTGMGFERVCSLIQNTKGFTDFSKTPTNYATDVFQPIFRKLESLSGSTYRDIYPDSAEDKRSDLSDEMKEAIAFRVIADHIRTLTFSLADGILPGNTGRNYVLRRILRRAVRYGRALGFTSDAVFLPELVDILAEQMNDVFPELRLQAPMIKERLRNEEASFNQTLDRGLAMFEEEAAKSGDTLNGAFAFKLYDTYGFPVDLTRLLCVEHDLEIDMASFEEQMEAQRTRARNARSRALVRAADITTKATTVFTGFGEDESVATVLEIHPHEDALLVVTDRTPFYSEMGGQLGDQGTLHTDGTAYPITSVQQIGSARAHKLPPEAKVSVGDTVTLSIDPDRRRPIEAHHSATHLLHWALREIVSPNIAQQGSLVSRRRLRFDFNSDPLDQDQLEAIELKVNQCIEANDSVSVIETLHSEVKARKDIQQFFGDKYGERVRVVQIGGRSEQLDGYSMELCGGTHVRHTRDIGLFKIKSEGAIASGVRRIEAVCGTAAYDWIRNVVEKTTADEKELRARLDGINKALERMGAETVHFGEFPHIMSGMLAEGDFEQKNQVFKDLLAHLQELKSATATADKALKKKKGAEAADMAQKLILDETLSTNLVIQTEGPADLIQELIKKLKNQQFGHVAFCIVDDGDKLHLGAFCGETAKSAGNMTAGKLIQSLAPLAGGKGGGKPDMARGSAPERSKSDTLEAAAKKMLKS